MQADDDYHARAVIIGLDAFDADIATAMVDDGRLPTLASLFDSAAWARTITPPGLVVGGNWPTITTGCWPSRHGFYCDRQFRSGTYETRKLTPRDVTKPRLWDALDAAGERCLVLDAPISAPSALAHGSMLVEYGAHDRFVPTSSEPPDLAHDVIERLGTYPLPHMCDDYARGHGYRALRDALVTGVDLKTRLICEAVDRGGWDFLFAAFCESHCAGHHFWSHHDETHPSHDAATRAELGDVLLAVYETVDAGLGAVLERVPRDASIVVLLSHGIGPHYDGGHLMSEVLRRLDRSSGERRFVAFRERVIRRLGRSARRREQALPVDSALRFFKVPNNDLHLGIRFNVVGREPRGCLHRGEELDRAIAELCADLRDIRNAETGKPVFTEFLRTTEIYDGPAVDALPDLLVGWSRAAPIRGLTSRLIGEVWGEGTSIRTGDHRQGGLVFIRNTGVPRGELPEPLPVVDLAPTVADWFGVKLADVDGAPLRV